MQSLYSTPYTCVFGVFKDAINITLPVKLLTFPSPHESGPPERRAVLISAFGSPYPQC